MHGQTSPRRPLAGLPLRDLMERLVGRSRLLAQQEIELAKTEAKEHLRQESRTAAGLGVAGVCALIAVTMLFVAIAFLLDIWLPGWLSALLAGAFALIVGATAGLVGWAKRVRDPMGITRRTVQGDIRWLRERRV